MLNIDEGIKKLEIYLTDQHRSKFTIISYINDLKQLGLFLKSKQITNLEQVTPDILNEYKQNMLNNPKYSVKSVSRKVNSIRLLFRFLFNENLLSTNAAANLTHPKFKNADPRVLSQTEYMAIRDASRSDTKLYSMIELLLQTGMRVGELVRLKLNDISEQDGKTYLEITPFQSQAGRKIPLNEKATMALKKWLSIRPNVNSQYIYVTRTAKPIIVRNLRISLLRIFRKAGVENATVNDLRNTFISYYITKGVPKENIAKMVGHKNLATIDRYKHFLQKKENKSKEDITLVL